MERRTLSRSLPEASIAMASKRKPVPPPLPPPDPITELLQSSPVTTEDYLAHIRALGQRIGGHIRFIGAVGSLSGTSVESKARAVYFFYHRLLAYERQLHQLRQNGVS